MSTDLPENILASLDSLLALRFQAGNHFLKSRKKTSAVSSGGYASPIRGRGMDFSEVRLYQPGDDIRSIDWRVTARTGKTHTKLFTEERERPVFFVIDTEILLLPCHQYMARNIDLFFDGEGRRGNAPHLNSGIYGSK